MLQFGAVESIKEEYRDEKRMLLLETLVLDVRYALRMMRKAPGFSAVVILTLVLSIGATTAIFSVVDATLLHPLPYPAADQLVSIEDDLPGVGARDVGMSEPDWQDLQHSGIFEYISPAWYDDNNPVGLSKPARVSLTIAAPNYFGFLKVSPQLGRTFKPEDHSPGFTDEVVISDAMWQRDFCGDPGVLGKSVRMDTDLYEIIGMMPSGFQVPGRSARDRKIDIWAATSFYGAPLADHGAHRGDVLRLVLHQGLRLALVGAVLASAGALIVTHLMAVFLYGVQPNDAATFVFVSLLLLTVALLACYLPARRATQIDPMVTLRYE